MKTAKDILFENLIGVNKESIQKHHDFLPSVVKAMNQFALQNTLNRDKVIDVISQKITLIDWKDEGKPFYLLSIDDFDEIINAICSLTLPTLSEEVKGNLGRLYDKYKNKGRQQFIDALEYYISTRLNTKPTLSEEEIEKVGNKIIEAISSEYRGAVESDEQYGLGEIIDTVKAALKELKVCNHNWVGLGHWDDAVIEQCTNCNLMREKN